MRHWLRAAVGMVAVVACGGGQPAESPTNEKTPVAQGAEPAPAAGAETTAERPESAPSEPSPDRHEPVKLTGDGKDAPISLNETQRPRSAHKPPAYKLQPTKTEAAMRFFVVDKARAETPIPGVVIAMTAPEGEKYYAKETDAQGYAEVLVPVGKTYELAYLSLGRREITAKVPVPDAPRQNIKLTLRYQRFDGEGRQMIVQGPPPPRVFVLAGVNFDTGKATLRPESLPHLDRVLEYMTHKPSSRIEISGHTDDVGKPEANKDLSQRRADACRAYLVKKGIDQSRIETVGWGSEKPVASNDSAQGRQSNRRIEAKELSPTSD